MFAEIIEYENVLDKINEYELTESQIDTLINIIMENPTISVNRLLEITDEIANNQSIIIDGGTIFSIDPILNESEKVVNLMEIVIPVITKHIPKEIIGYLTETHARKIVESILSVKFDENTSALDLRNRIDEMFAAGEISIPMQGLRVQPNTMEVVVYGVFAPMLYKGIQFGKEQYKKPSKSHCKNKGTLKQALQDYKLYDKEETPLMKLLPKFVITIKDLLGKK